MLLFPWEIPGKILNISAQKESVFQEHLQLFTSELFVVGFVVLFFFPSHSWSHPTFNVKSQGLLSATPVSSCCTEVAGMLICSLEFYPALSEIYIFLTVSFLLI